MLDFFIWLFAVQILIIFRCSFVVHYLIWFSNLFHYLIFNYYSLLLSVAYSFQKTNWLVTFHLRSVTAPRLTFSIFYSIICLVNSHHLFSTSQLFTDFVSEIIFLPNTSDWFRLEPSLTPLTFIMQQVEQSNFDFWCIFIWLKWRN